ncbi:MAG: ABC transporter ATP-binding protein [Chloroflexota bacterium]|nr:ABC transporter ATP-binding protein/permease [Dehalococcoidia bacterium]MDW8253511.1 ABC transporter ATP-binding protein [Chloroflexota bacterium]
MMMGHGLRGRGPMAGGRPERLGLPKALPRSLRFLRPYWRSTLVAFGGLVLVTVTTLASPQLVRLAIDRGLEPRDLTLLLLTTGGMLAIALIRGAASFAQTYGSERAAQGLAYELRDALFTHIQRQSFSFYDSIQTGQLLTRITSDVEQVRLFASAGLLQAISAVTLLLGSVAVLVALNWKLAILALLPIPLVLLLVFGFLAKAGPLFGQLQQKVGELNSILQENIAGVRVVRAFTRERVEEARFGARNRELLETSLRTLHMISLNFPLVFFLGNLGGVLVVLVGGIDVINGALTIGELIAFNSYLAFLLFPVLSLGFLSIAAARADASAVRIFEVLDSNIEVADKPGAIDLPPIQGRVEFDHVWFRYPGDQRPVLEDISFVVEPGQTVAILGATGSGKSTLVNLLPRFYDPTSGAVRIDGHDLRDVTLASLRSQIGIVLQETQLIRGTIRENIAFGKPDATDEEIRAAAEAAQAAEFIDQLPQGYQTVVGDRGVGLSGGQKQRIAIARALLVRPRLLILDDSTSAVDAATEAKIQAALDALIRDKQSTVFVIAQRVSTVRDADRILLLEEGRLVASGTHEELLADSQLYNDILGSQLRPDAPEAVVGGGTDVGWN